MMTFHRGLVGIALLVAAAVAGCSNSPTNRAGQTPGDGPAGGPAKQQKVDAEVQAERDKLGADERAAVEAQEWCVVQTDNPLGSMGPPVKLTIKGQPVYLCCIGCRKKAEADPDATLARVEELKAKKKAAKSSK